MVTKQFKQIYKTYTHEDFPEDPYLQLKLGTEAVFKSWNSKRAHAYRDAAGISHDLGTAVNIQAMVYGKFRRIQEPESPCPAMLLTAGTNSRAIF